jgi:uncharacterized protein YjbI with pentapeptide repeats
MSLAGMNLRGAWLEGANLREADLRGADLREAQLQGATPRRRAARRRAICTRPTCGTRRSSARRSPTRDFDSVVANLTDTRFTDALMAGTDVLADANLTRAVFDNCGLAGCRPARRQPERQRRSTAPT